MGSVKGVNIAKVAPSSAVAAGKDSTSGFICNGVAVSGKLVLATVYKLLSTRDANALGLDDAYDTANSALVYYHIKEFYARPENVGATLYIMVVAQSVTLPVMVLDATGIYGKKMQIAAKGQICQIGFAYNPATYSPTLLNGLDADVLTAIANGQTLADYCFGIQMPLRVVIEGKAFNGSVSSAQDLTAITDVIAPNVCVVIGQDFDVAAQLTLWNKHAAVGTFLGCVAARKVNENPGWVDVGNLTDVSNGRWLNAAFSSHALIETLTDDWQALSDKGYIFPQTYSRVDGFYWNGDPSCCTPTKDTEGNINDSNMHYGRTFDKAAKTLYAALIGSAKSPQPVDPATGKLPSGVVVYFKGLAENKIDRDMGAEISGRSVFVDPNSDLITAKVLNAGVKVVPFGSTDAINVSLSLNASL